jgi:hypothetical protein
MINALMPLPDSRSTIDFGIQIDFDRESHDPARIFRTMSGLISSFQQLDHSLVESIDISIEPVLLLEDVEAGSIKVWLREQIEGIEDDALKSGDWKKIAGQFLVKGKYILLRFLQDNKKLPGRADIIRLQGELLRAAEETQLRGLPVYRPVPIQNLLGGIKSVNEALNQLGDRDTAKFISAEGDTDLTPIVEFSLSDIEELLTQETVIGSAILILKVKKPDYLGTSKWEFVFEHAMEVKILDFDWLVRFQNREVDVRPGDALRAEVLTEVKYGYGGDVIGMTYTIRKVLEVIPYTPPQQFGLPSGPDHDLE